MYALVCGLFTARWVLEALGQVDFGLYGLVGQWERWNVFNTETQRYRENLDFNQVFLDRRRLRYEKNIRCFK